MTGYGDATLDADGVHYFVELRSLNNKYFKASLRLPEDLQPLEPEIDAELRRRLVRGTITLIAKVSVVGESAAMMIDHAALDRYIEQLHQSPHVASGQVKFDAAALLALPGVLKSEADDSERVERARTAMKTLLAEACRRLLEMRAREGEALAEDLRLHLKVVRDRLDEVKQLAPQMVADYEERLRTRIESMMEQVGASVEPPDLVRELASFAERSDVAEEVQRLSTHLDQFESLIASADGRSIGRTMDFLAQEMLREANTIASKASDARIARDIVEVKGAIDRIKEQVQNVE